MHYNRISHRELRYTVQGVLVTKCRFDCYCCEIFNSYCVMSLFSSLNTDDQGPHAHWMSSPNNGSENAGIGGGSTSPRGSCPPGFDPAVGRPSSGLPGGSNVTSPSTSQLGLLNTTRYQPPTGAGVALSREDQFYCKVCKVNLSGAEPAKQHYAGKQHRKVLQAQESCQRTGDGSTLPLECTICQKKFSGQPSARQHFESSKHKTAVAGATVWAQSQGQGGTVPQGAHQRPPPGLSPPGMSPLGVSAEGITASGPEATKETLNMPTSSGAGQHAIPLMDAAKDGVSNQQLYQRSSPGGLPTFGGGGLQQPTRNAPSAISAEDFTAAVRNGNQQLRQHIGQICYSVLERYLMQLIPDLCDKITDKVLEELSKATPQDSSSREAAARPSPRQNGSAEELQESIKTDYASMPSLLESLSLNSLEPGAGKSSEAVNIMNNLNGPSPQQYSAIWDSLMEHKK